MAGSLHTDVASAIGRQVEQMILQAKIDSEARVRHDLQVARNQLSGMEAAIADLGERVARCASANGPGAPEPIQIVDRDFLTQKISQLEQKWGFEVKALKQDLHRTILAHNHNSDLMRHHRDALEEARRKLDAQMHPKPEQVDAQIEKVDRLLRAGQAKQRAVDALTDRLAALEVQVGEMLPGQGLMPPFAGLTPGMAHLMGQAGVLGQQQLQQQGEPNKTLGNDEGPTEEEVRARFLKASRAGAANDSASGFNAEAPVFVPRGAGLVADGEAADGAAVASGDDEGGPEEKCEEEGSIAAAQDDADLQDAPLRQASPGAEADATVSGEDEAEDAEEVKGEGKHEDQGVEEEGNHAGEEGGEKDGASKAE
mmetsp:Transcript_86513/g.249625  ORF Transcript_86513/g.249625 Transcript_86513/m.249625 type:complete len:369 (+) Transcript_86513:90-1196(+)